MSELKIKVTWNGMTVELEGEAENVKEIFNSLKDSGMGRMDECDRKVVSMHTDNMKEKIENENIMRINEDGYEEQDQIEIPSLSNVVLVGGPRTESEWILVYAFYKSEQGTQFFSRDDLRQCYRETNRYTDIRNKNFSKNVRTLISDKLISAVNQNDFRIERKGIELATKIVCGEITEKDGKGSKKKISKAKTGVTETYNLVDLNLSQDERSALVEFYSEHSPANHQDKTVVIAKWLKDVKGIDEVNKDIVFTVLRTLGESTSFNISQTSVYKGYKRDKIEMRVDRVEVSDFPLYLNTVAGGLDCRDQTIGGFSFVVKIYAVPVVEIIR